MDETILEKNIEGLCRAYAGWRSILKDTARGEDVPVRGDFAEAQGKKVLCGVKEGRVYQLDTLYDTSRLMEMWFALFPEVNRESRFVWFGFGNGMYVRKILSETPDSVQIVVYEPSLEILYTVLSGTDLRDIWDSGRVHLIVPQMDRGYLSALLYRYIDYTNKKYMEWGCYLNYGALFPEEREAFYGEVQNVLNAVNSTQNVLERYGKYYLENTLANYPYLVEGCTLEQLYYALPKDIPAIVVASGPSLDKNVEELRQAKGRALIIAVDSALHVMVERGILPDIFITVDALKLPAHFADMEVRDIPMICCLQGNKNVLGLHTGKKFFFDDENPFVAEFFKAQGKEFAGVSTGGSVANDAFSVADTLRFTTIILVGQDLAYTDNKGHASNSVQGEVGENIFGRDLVSVEGYGGGTVYSSPEFQLYRKWFENEIRTNDRIRVINCTEGGARIRGAEELPLRAAILRECGREEPVEKRIGEIPPFFSAGEQAQFLAHMASAVERLENLERLAEKGVRTYERLRLLAHTGKYRSGEADRLISMAGELGAQIEGEPAAYFAECLMYEENSRILEDVYEESGDERQELLHAADKGIQYLSMLRDTIRDSLPHLREELVLSDPGGMIRKNRALSQIQLLINRIEINAKKEERYWDEQ